MLETTLATVSVPANSMGPNGSVIVTAVWSYTNSANVKTMRGRFGGTTFYQTQPTVTASRRSQWGSGVPERH